MVTAIGSHACVSRPTKWTPSSCLPDGIATSRFGTWPTANWSWTTTDTTDTWTLLPFHLMVLSALPVEKIARLSCGIWMMASICILWTTTTSSTPCASPPTVTGCALHTDPTSRFGTWQTRKWLRNSAQVSLLTPRPIHHNACHSLGLLMDKLCSLDTLTTRFAFMESLFALKMGVILILY